MILLLAWAPQALAQEPAVSRGPALSPPQSQDPEPGQTEGLVPSTPSGRSLSPAEGTLILAGGERDSLVVVDLEGFRVVRAIPVGTEVRGCALLPGGESVYLALPFEDEVWRLNLATGEVEALISTGIQGHSSVAVVGDTAYVASAREPVLARVHIPTDRVLESIPLVSPVHMLHPSRDGRFLFLSFTQAHRVGVLDVDTSTLVREIPVGRVPYGLEVSGDRRLLYVALRGENRVQVLDLDTLQEVDSLYVNVTRGGLGDLRWAPAGHLLVGETYGRTLWLLDPVSREALHRLDLSAPVHQMVHPALGAKPLDQDVPTSAAEGVN